MKKIIALLLAIAMVAAFVGCAKEDKPAETTAAAAATEAPETTEAASAPQEAEGEVMTHADYIAAPENSPVCIETYVQAHQDWRENKVSVYAQSEDGAYFLYRMECSEEQAAKLVPGTKIRVMGFKGIHHGEIEVAEEGTFEILEGSYIAPAQDITGGLSASNLIDWQNAKIKITGLTVEKANDAGDAFLYNWDGSGAAGSNNDLYFNVSDGTNTYTFTVESDLCGEGTDVYTAVTNLKVGDTIDVEGFLYWYDGMQPHVTSVTVK